MTHPIIKTDNYLLITSDEEINSANMYEWKGWWHELKKVIAHLPLNNSPIIEGVPLLPPIPNEEDEIIENLENYLLKVNQLYKDWLGIGFKGGYHKAKEKYKFTENDMKFAIKEAFLLGVERHKHYSDVEDKIISSFSQPKLPVGFNPQIGVCNRWLADECNIDCCGNPEKKIVINGVMQGEWIFE